MRTPVGSHITAANDLTARWGAAVGDGDFVISGAGVWPLLALLAAAAEEPARSELEAAIELPVDEAQAAALELLRTLADSVDVSAALGVWVRSDLPLHEEWVRRFPDGTIDRLTGKDALDRWAARHTRDLIDRFPLDITPDMVLVLATALVAKTTWQTPFEDAVLVPKNGPWHGLRGRGLARTTSDLNDVAVLDGSAEVTRVVVTGTADLDVHLLVGDGTPGTILTTGLAALSGAVPVRSELPVGTIAPGLRVTTETSPSPLDRLVVQLPPFDIRSSHNLCAQPELFGLTTATDPAHGHFPAISPEPLYVTSGAQDVLARFTREGFESAAVTAFGVAIAAAMPTPGHTITKITATFDRPFAFMAVHRPTALAVTAGWIATLPTTG